MTGSTIAVTDEAGMTKTFAVDATTTLTKGGVAATLFDLVIGDGVRITTSATSVGTAAGIEIDLAHAAGKVVSKSGSSIVVSDRGGGRDTIVVNASTTFTLTKKV